MVALPYGRASYPVDLGDRRATIVTLPEAGAVPSISTLLDEALDHPIDRPRVEDLVRPGDRVTVIVSDGSRREPRSAFLSALRSRLPEVTWTVAIATGTHGPVGPAAYEALGLDGLGESVPIVDHDGHRDDDLVELGTTTRGTVARVHRCVVDADLVIATGCIRPHYFAGFGAGAKAIFPGLGAAGEIRRNHLLKQEPGARAGIVDGNPCRANLEEAVSLLGTPTFLLDGVCAADGEVHAAVAGDLRTAFRAGVERARPWFTAAAPSADLVIASDALPVAASVYQAAKIAAAVAPLVLPHGMLLVVAECADGLAPNSTVEAARHVVNEAIVRIGVLPRLAEGVRLGLVSSLPDHLVKQTLFEPIASVADALNQIRGSVVLVPRASSLLIR